MSETHDTIQYVHVTFRFIPFRSEYEQTRKNTPKFDLELRNSHMIRAIEPPWYCVPYFSLSALIAMLAPSFCKKK